MPFEWLEPVAFSIKKGGLNSPIFVCLQAEFGDLNLASYSDSGTMVDIQVYREGTVVVRSAFSPNHEFSSLLHSRF